MILGRLMEVKRILRWEVREMIMYVCGDRKFSKISVCKNMKKKNLIYKVVN